MSIDKPHNIHKIGLPVQLAPGIKKINAFDHHLYHNEMNQPKKRRASVAAFSPLEPPISRQHSILSRERSD